VDLVTRDSRISVGEPISVDIFAVLRVVIIVSSAQPLSLDQL
jgi:hypothetical protein